LSKADVEAMGFERLTAEIDDILRDPVFAAWPADRQLPMIERVSAIYTGYWHASGHALIPALEDLFRRAVAIPDARLEILCLFYDLLYFLYWYVASDFEAMRGVADHVMPPFAEAVRGGGPADLPAIVSRPLGRAPLRLGYLSQFARLGNPIGPCAHAVLGGLSRYLAGTYRLVLYAWSEHDDASL